MSMPRPAREKTAELTINLKTDQSRPQKGEESPDPKSSSPMNLSGIDLSSFGGDIGSGLTSLPRLPNSPPTSPRLPREPSKNAVDNFKSRMSPEQDQTDSRSLSRPGREDDEANKRPNTSSMSKVYHLRQNPGSSPELSLVGSAEEEASRANEVDSAREREPRPPLSPYHSEDSVATRRRDRGFRNPLARSKSIRRDSNSKTKQNGQSSRELPPPKTAPLSTAHQNSSSDMLGDKRKKEKRGKSTERANSNAGHLQAAPQQSFMKESHKEKEKGGVKTGGKTMMSKAKTGGGNFLTRLGKFGRSSSTHEKEVPDSEYVIKVINRPLIDQVRITRISKDLAKCRDKTEYWMPSLPWRCVDYLNLNCESEGLYRVPGSGPQVKHWQRRFDSELDVDLLSETELYDPNNIGSMFKSWLRDLPTQIMDKELQHKLGEELAKDNPDYQKVGQPAPKKLRDALSNLPPFNYYLLFAVTCHLSLLLSHQESNRMDLNNLSICIGPCLHLERWLFNYLVGDWRNCWQGCFNEKDYLEAEKAFEQGLEYETPASRGNPNRNPDNTTYPIPSSSSHITSRNTSRSNVADDRAAYSSGSGASKPASQYEDARPTLQQQTRPDTSPARKENFAPTGQTPLTSASTPTLDRAKRPATAGAREAREDESGPASADTTPRRLRHHRSHSDAPGLPGGAGVGVSKGVAELPALGGGEA